MQKTTQGFGIIGLIFILALVGAFVIFKLLWGGGFGAGSTTDIGTDAFDRTLDLHDDINQRYDEL